MQSIEGMIIILPKVVSEHFMLKERLGKQETLIDTDSSAYANQKKSLHCTQAHLTLYAFPCSATPTHPLLFPSSNNVREAL